jgi:hypothetical protein
MPIVRSKEGYWSRLSYDRSIRWHYHFGRYVGHLFTVCHVFDASSGEDADGSIVTHVCFVSDKSSPALSRAEGGCR